MKTYPLTASQSEMFMEWDLNHDMTQYNMAGHMDFETHCIDKERLEKALKKLLSLRPYLYNRLVRVSENEVPELKYYNDPTRLIRQYPEYNQDIELKLLELSDEECSEYLNTPTSPYNPFEEPMARFTLIQTPSHHVIVYDFFHLLVDGVTIKRINSDIETLYRGEEISAPDTDFYEVAQKEYEMLDSEQYLIDKTFMENKFKDFKKFTDFNIPFEEDEPWGKTIFEEKHIPYKRVDEWTASHNVSSPDLLMAIYAKTLSIVSGEQNIIFYTPNHGRSAKSLKNVFYGHTLRPMVISLNVNPNDDILALTKQVKIEMFSNLRHRVYPIWHYFLSHEEFDDYGTEFLYDGLYMDFDARYDKNISYWRWLDFGVTLNHLVFTVYQRGSNYVFETECSDKLYKPDKINRFISIYLDVLEKTI